MLPKPIRQLRGWAHRKYLSIGASRECPICGWTGHGFKLRHKPNKCAPSIECPSCRSLSRHRFCRLALGNRIPRGKLLHVAPEPRLADWIRSLATEYLSIDLEATNVMAHMDVCDLELADESFGVIWCSHVLEHVPEDRKAMSEFYRVLKPGGLLIALVPISGMTTDEDPSITDPQERLGRFGQANHVRYYGLDFVDRLQASGFRVETLRLREHIEPDAIERYGLDYPSTREIFLASK